MSRLASKLTRNSALSLATVASNAVVGFLLGIALARGLGPEEYGNYAYFMWLASLGGMVIHLGLGPMATKYISEALGRDSQRDALAVTQLILMGRVLAALLLSLLVLSLASLLASLFVHEGYTSYFILLAVGLLPYMLFQTFQSIFNGFQRYEFLAYEVLAVLVLRAVAILVLLALGFGVVPLLIANIVSWALGTALACYLLLKLVPGRALLSLDFFHSPVVRRALGFASVSIGVLGLDYIVWQRAEVFFLGRYWTSTEVGLYAIAFGVPTMAMSLMSGGIGPVLFPAVSELFARNDQGNVKTIYLTSARYLMFLTLPLCAIGIALAGPLVRLLYGGDYAPAVVPMQIIFVAMAVFAVLPSAHAVLNGIDRPDLVLKVGLATAPLSVGLSLMLIPSYGVLGAAVGSSIPQFLSFFLTTWLVRRQLHVWWPWLDTIKVGAVSAVVALSMLQIQGLVPGTGGAAISLVAGIAIYLTGIVAARALRQEDLLMLKTLVPPVLRAKYVSFLGLAVRVVKT